MGSGSYHVEAPVVNHDLVLTGAFKQIEIVSHWAKTLFFCVSVMLVLYVSPDARKCISNINVACIYFRVPISVTGPTR